MHVKINVNRTFLGHTRICIVCICSRSSNFILSIYFILLFFCTKYSFSLSKHIKYSGIFCFSFNNNTRKRLSLNKINTKISSLSTKTYNHMCTCVYICKKKINYTCLKTLILGCNKSFFVVDAAAITILPLLLI